MPASALALVLAAGLLHAAWNILAKRAGGDRHFIFICSAMIVVLWSPLGLVLAREQAPGWGWTPWAMLAASCVLNLAYAQVLFKGYRVADLTVVYPVARGTGPLISALGAALVLGETLGPRSVAGVAAVCGGVFLIAGGPGLRRAAHDPERRGRVRAGLAWGALTGVLIAGYSVADGYTVKRLAVAPVLVVWIGNLMRLPLMAPQVLRDRAGLRRCWRERRRPVFWVAVLSPLAYMLVLQAVRLAPLSHVAPAREISMLFAALLGGRLLGEGERGPRLAGAVAMGVGVALLAF